jgi:hypothetical protein
MERNGWPFGSLSLSLSLPIVLNHHPMTSLFVFLILPSFDNKPSHLNRRRRREKKWKLDNSIQSGGRESHKGMAIVIL